MGTSNYIFGRSTVTTPGTPIQLPNIAIAHGADVCINAMPSNTGNCYLATSSSNVLDATKRRVIDPGMGLESMRPTNLNLFWLDSTVAGEGIEYTIEGST